MLLLTTSVASGEERQKEYAAQYGGQGWSVQGGETIGAGANALTLQAGFPGISLGYLRGIASGVDLGGRFTFNYGYEGLVTTIVPGIKGEMVGRVRLLDTGRLSLGLNLGFGVFGYFGPFSSVVGVSLPVGISFGIPIASALAVSFSIDAPMFVTFGATGGLTFPLLLGGGFEYFVDKSFALTFNTKMGPAVYPKGFNYGDRADFDFQALFGLAYRL